MLSHFYSVGCPRPKPNQHGIPAGERIIPFLSQATVRNRQVSQLNHSYNVDGVEMENVTMEEMKYKVVNGSVIDDVSEISNKLMDEGYVPAGGINYIPSEHLYTQVMFWEPKSIMGTL